MGFDLDFVQAHIYFEGALTDGLLAERSLIIHAVLMHRSGMIYSSTDFHTYNLEDTVFMDVLKLQDMRPKQAKWRGPKRVGWRVR